MKANPSLPVFIASRNSWKLSFRKRRRAVFKPCLGRPLNTSVYDWSSAPVGSVETLYMHVPSLKLTVRPWKKAGPQKETSKYSNHSFSGATFWGEGQWDTYQQLVFEYVWISAIKWWKTSGGCTSCFRLHPPHHRHLAPSGRAIKCLLQAVSSDDRLHQGKLNSVMAMSNLAKGHCPQKEPGQKYMKSVARSCLYISVLVESVPLQRQLQQIRTSTTIERL